MDPRPAPLPAFDDEAVLSRDRGRLLRLLAAVRKAPADAGKRADTERDAWRRDAL